MEMRNKPNRHDGDHGDVYGAQSKAELSAFYDLGQTVISNILMASDIASPRFAWCC